MNIFKSKYDPDFFYYLDKLLTDKETGESEKMMENFNKKRLESKLRDQENQKKRKKK